MNMNIIDIDRWQEIWMTITRNKTRSLLTAFGVFWGIFMLVALIGGGNGLQNMMSRSFSGIATNSYFFMSQQTSEAYKGFRKGRYWNLEMNDIDILRSNIKEIEYITPILFGGWKDNNTVYGDKAYTAGVKGVLPEYEKIEAQKITYGRFINDMDVKEQRKVCFIGKRIYEALFNKGENPSGKFIRIDGIYYQVIGVAGDASDNISIGGNAEEMVVLPFSTMQMAYHAGNNVDLIGLTGKPDVPISRIQEQVETIIKQNHLIAPNDAQALFSMNMEKMFKQFDNLFLGIRLLIWIVGLGTLFAGIIGVSNIMMVTVRERTGEIGIRRAIGARPFDIMRQILSESMILTSIAGFLGISFAVLVLQVVNVGISSSADYDAGFQISFGVAVGTAVILMTLGTLAGLAPAFRAMSIKPIEAIREE